MSVPAHKQTNPAHAPGQIKTIGQYVEGKYPEAMKKKLTFGEWWVTGVVSRDNPYRANSSVFWAYEGWLAAQENV